MKRLYKLKIHHSSPKFGNFIPGMINTKKEWQKIFFTLEKDFCKKRTDLFEKIGKINEEVYKWPSFEESIEKTGAYFITDSFVTIKQFDDVKQLINDLLERYIKQFDNDTGMLAMISPGCHHYEYIEGRASQLQKNINDLHKIKSKIIDSYLK